MRSREDLLAMLTLWVGRFEIAMEDTDEDELGDLLSEITEVLAQEENTL